MVAQGGDGNGQLPRSAESYRPASRKAGIVMALRQRNVSESATRREIGFIRRAAVFLAVAAGLAASGRPAAAQEWAKKMFSVTSHNFGTVARGSKTEYRFVFRNLYEEDIHVSGVRTSCGCTSPSVTKKLLKTHETSEVVATFNTRTFLGQHGATLTVTFDRPFTAEVQLRVAGNIRGDVTFEPPS